jgi:hypothetical protein
MNQKPWQKPQPPPQPVNIDLQVLMSMHQYFCNLADPSPTTKAILIHLETQLHTAITGIIATQGPTQ